MGLSDILGALWYELKGLRTPCVSLEQFALVFSDMLEQMIPSAQIIGKAKIDLKREWEPDLEQEIIDAHRTHLLSHWQPAHNALNSLKVERLCQKLHREAMLASRAYGETVVNYIEYRTMFLSEAYLTDAYFRKQQDGKDWDSLTREYTRSVIRELESIASRDASAYRLLMPAEAVLNGVSHITADMPESLAFNYAVVPFE